MQVDQESPREAAPGRASSGRSEGSSVGGLLRAARMRHGLELQDVSSALRIRLVHLQAIEEGRFADLPGATYAIGFVRAYADFLGLDADEVVARFRSEVSILTKRPELNFPAPVPESRVPSGAVLLISAVLAAVAYGGWYYVTMGNRGGLELISEVPQRLAGLLQSGPGEEAPPSTTTPPQAAAGEAVSATEALGPEALPRHVSPPEEAVAEAAVEEAPSESPPGETAAVWSGPGEPAAEAETGAAEGEAASFPAGPSAEETPALVAEGSQAEPPEADAVADARTAETAEAEALQSEDAATLPAGEGAGAQPSEVQVAGAEAEGPGEAAPSAVTQAPEETVETAGAEVPAAVTEAREEVAAVPPVPVAPEPPPAVGTAAPQVFGKANVDARIVIRAKDESWVQVRDASGGLVLTRMLRPGDSYRVPNRSGLVLLTGNAGALEIYVDGRLAPPIGPGGAIRRDVVLDAERLLAGTAVQD